MADIVSKRSAPDDATDSAVLTSTNHPRSDTDAGGTMMPPVQKKTKRSLAVPPPDIPLSAHYHISWMHASPITSVDVSLKHGYVISGDTAGIVKFWKRSKVVLPDAPVDASARLSASSTSTGKPCLEFVKAYTAHTSSVRCIQVDTSSGGGDACVSASLDTATHTCRLKFYDVATFDAVSMVQLQVPQQQSSATSRGVADTADVCSCVWFHTSVESQTYVAVAVRCTILIVDPTRGVQHQTLHLHAAPITALVAIPHHHCILSADRAGTLDVWDTHGRSVVVEGTTTTTDEGDFGDVGGGAAAETSSVLQVGGPVTPQQHGITYKAKTDTDLYVLQRKHTWAVALAVTTSSNKNGTHYAVYSADHKLRVMEHATGQCLVTFQEGIKAYAKIFTNFGLDAMSFAKRSATDRDIVGVFDDHRSQRFQLQFDPTGTYLLIPTMMGIKVLDWKKRKMTGMAGKLDADSLRFVGCCLASGDAVVDQQIALARGASSTSRSEQDATKTTSVTDTLLIGVAYHQRRLYVYSHVDPVLTDGPDAISRRDVWNEAPTTSDQRFNTATSAHDAARTQSTKAILRTTKGDIHVQLFGQQVPKTMENFVGHCQSGYYDNVLFHRVIAGFMLQTGDPLGDGTGGESIWGDDFQDEIVPSLRHDRPFTVSMANKGPHTNGSQFFITTAPTPWLDGKHTVFGRVVRGMDICTQIEKVKTDKNDKPLDEIRIQNIDLE